MDGCAGRKVQGCEGGELGRATREQCLACSPREHTAPAPAGAPGVAGHMLSHCGPAEACRSAGRLGRGTASAASIHTQGHEAYPAQGAPTCRMPSGAQGSLSQILLQTGEAAGPPQGPGGDLAAARAAPWRLMGSKEVFGDSGEPGVRQPDVPAECVKLGCRPQCHTSDRVLHSQTPTERQSLHSGALAAFL